MSNLKYSYNTKWIITAIIIWELLFWLLFVVILWIFDYFSNSSSKLAFKDVDNLFYLSVLIPVSLAFIWYLFWKNKRLIRLGNTQILSLITQPIDSFSVFIRFFLLRNTIAFLIISMAQPIFGSKKVSGTLETMELVLAIDVSNSMNVKDIDGETSRLEVVKRAMNQLVNHLHGEKIGISIFAGSAYLQLPLTADYEAAKMYIHEIQTDMVSNQGTNIAAVLELSNQMFSKANTGKAILLVTDGENHEGGLDESIELIKEKKVSLAVLGIGTSRGGVIPVNPNRPELGYKRDARGKTITSKVNKGFIQSVAKKADGFSIISSSPFPNLDEILEQLKHMKRTKVDNIELDIKENWYQIPLFLGVICFILYILSLDFLSKNKN